MDVTNQDDKAFIANVFEIAFGNDAINRNFTYDEVLRELRIFADESFTEQERQVA